MRFTAPSKVLLSTLLKALGGEVRGADNDEFYELLRVSEARNCFCEQM